MTVCVVAQVFSVGKPQMTAPPLVDRRLLVARPIAVRVRVQAVLELLPLELLKQRGGADQVLGHSRDLQQIGVA